MNWKEKLTNIYNLATLHSWTNQIDEMIIDFLSNITENEEIIEYLLDEMQSENFNNEQNIISLVLLKYFDYPVLQIIDLANEKLYGKISKNDINFFKKHLFSGTLPLSSELSYDITNRSFLSPKKAIKRAMQIDSVISKENPQLTVLYMCFILSRMDMNEENRAMVAFLLLRIDIDLPPGLQQRVYKYLWEYKDIIQELLEEEEDGPVILENIQSLQEKISSVQIIEKKENSNLDLTQVIPQSPEIETNKENTKPDIEERKISIVNNQVGNTKSSFSNKIDKISVPVNTKNKALAKVIGNNIDSTEKTNNTSNFPPNEKKLKSAWNSAKKPTPLSVIEEGPLTQKSDKNDSLGGINSHNVPYEKGSTNPEVIYNVDKFAPNKTIEKEKEYKSKKTDSLNTKNWSINLKKSKDILESILNGIFKKSSSEADTHKISNNILKKSKSSVSNSKGLKIIKHKKLFMGVGVLIILGLSIYFSSVKNTNYNTAETNKINESVPGADVIIGNSENLISQSNLPILANNKVSENTDPNIPEGFPFNVSVEGNNLSWKVAKGDSITGLFYALKDYKTRLIGTPLEKLSNMDWTTFFNDFKNNNPERTSYHIIFPSEIFVFSLD